MPRMKTGIAVPQIRGYALVHTAYGRRSGQKPKAIATSGGAANSPEAIQARRKQNQEAFRAAGVSGRKMAATGKKALLKARALGQAERAARISKGLKRAGGINL